MSCQHHLVTRPSGRHIASVALSAVADPQRIEDDGAVPTRQGRMARAARVYLDHGLSQCHGVPRHALRPISPGARAVAPRLFFFNDPPTTEIYTLSLHDALPI